MSVVPEQFTRAMARVPGPVVVATTVDRAGRRWGFTASSFSSLSIAPPLVLVCLGKSASTHAAFAGADFFMINILAEEQADIARCFARSGVDRFAAGDTLPMELGLPGIPNAAARVACAMDRIVDGGDHSILIGRVEATFAGEDAPLVYCDRSFQRPVALDAARYV
ncbi:flavin reductase family protein [Kitasatospora aureofaciens]|uniref:flavin reductase family protein n=1 Tax=Kitasatospora aureofaciens TaxID=1894 RepID=UPI001C43B842|nr:flavin reductase family protein [Kitasatospora aureofaciens]MBV6698104.1 flavin reductase family protein [Kitasatospora aureofaciens]